MMRERGIKDLMLGLDRLTRVSSQKTVGEVLKEFRGKAPDFGTLFLLVVDKKKNREEILGTLSTANIMDSIDLSINLDGQIPIFWRGQFAEECGAVLQKRTFEVMSPIVNAVNENGTLMEALHLMISKDNDTLAVLNGKDVVGILIRRSLREEMSRIVKYQLSA
jgi:CBS domain